MKLSGRNKLASWCFPGGFDYRSVGGFKGFCSLQGKSVSQGIIESMISVIEPSSGGMNDNLRAILGEYQLSGK